mgnify:CR=1 FL=1
MNPFTRCLSCGLRRRGTGFTGLVLVIGATAAVAQITLDGTLGPAGPLSGPDYRIPAEMGQQHGRNLFHSFGQFNIRGGESATFSGPNGIDNIIGRVTGGEASWIDGALSSTVPDANLYLLNPAGILFGPNARLDVQGSFHASTADDLRLGESGRFGASNPADSLLSTDPPSAFGFLSEHPAPITLRGSNLEVPAGKSLSLVGGDIALNGSELIARSGNLRITGKASSGEVKMTDMDGGLATSGIGGTITIVDGSTLDTSGESGGSVVIRGGRLELRGSTIQADTGDQNGKGIDIDLQSDLVAESVAITAVSQGAGDAGSIVVRADAISLKKGARITTNPFKIGRGGDISLAAGSILFEGRGSVPFDEGILPSGLYSDAKNSGPAGTISVKARDLTLRGGVLGATASAETTSESRGGDIVVQVTGTLRMELAEDHNSGISAETFGAAAAGNIFITAADVQMVGGHIDANSSFDGKPPATPGNAGNIVVRADVISLKQGAKISSITSKSGRGGNISLTAADSILLEGRGPENPSDAESAIISSGVYREAKGSGPAGTISIKARDLTLRGGVLGTTASAGTTSKSRGGDIEVQVTDTLRMEPDAEGKTGGITAETFGGAAAGNISITAADVQMVGGKVEANSVTDEDSPDVLLGKAGRISLFAEHIHLTKGAEIKSITAGLRGEGDNSTGGDIALNAQDITLSENAQITAQSRGGKDAGNIALTADEGLHAQNSRISTEAEESAGGNIDIQAPRLVTLIGSDITTSVRSGSASAGSITITKPAALILAEGSRIKADAISGRGGFVNLAARTVEQSADSTITADALFDGQIRIESSGELTSGLAVLPANFFDAARILTTPCAERWESDVIRLTVQRYESLPDSPYGLRAAPAASAPARLTFPETAADAGAENWLLAADGCAGDG